MNSSNQTKTQEQPDQTKNTCVLNSPLNDDSSKAPDSEKERQELMHEFMDKYYNG